MAKYERAIAASESAIASYLDEGIRASGMSVELVDSSVQRIRDVTVRLFVYDKYYMRNSSRAALTVQIVGNGDSCSVIAIGAGGGNGSFLSFSYGAEEDFVAVVERLLDDYREKKDK